MFEFLFSEDIDGFNSNDISVTGGLLANSPDLGVFTYIPNENSLGTIDINVGKGAAFDFAGNPNADKLNSPMITTHV